MYAQEGGGRGLDGRGKHARLRHRRRYTRITKVRASVVGGVSVVGDVTTTAVAGSGNPSLPTGRGKEAKKGGK